MSQSNSRREFLAEVGKGMLVAGLGSGLAAELGLAHAFAEESPKRLTFDKLEPLVSLIQESPLEKLLPALTAKIAEGTDLRTLVAAGSLANARTFGGQDYIGYHSFMALPPAYEMTRELPEKERALPVFKVLYRNASRIQAVGGSKSEVLHPIPDTDARSGFDGTTLREAARKADMEGAERQFAQMAKADLDAAYNALQQEIQDEVDVHRVVLSWRAWTMLDIAGKEYAHTLLRQSVRYCVDVEKRRMEGRYMKSGIRDLLPKLMDQNKLDGKSLGKKPPEDSWVLKLAETIYGSNRDKAAKAVAMALAEGFAPEAIGEAMSLASTMLVLRDPGRTKDDGAKLKGSVHGDSTGVHASDSVNAWRGIARVSNPRNTVASLIVGAYHTGGQSGGQTKESQPFVEQLEKVTTKDATKLLDMMASAIRAKDQALASVIAMRYGETGQSEKALFDVLLKFAISEDGALHAEKYYRTVREEFAATRAAFRWQHLTALARVTASEFGVPAPGYAEACRLTKG